MRFIEALNIPLIATLKDTQLYVQTTGDGLGITEIRHRRAYREATQLTRIANWLDERSLNITAESALSL